MWRNHFLPLTMSPHLAGSLMIVLFVCSSVKRSTCTMYQMCLLFASCSLYHAMPRRRRVAARYANVSAVAGNLERAVKYDWASWFFGKLEWWLGQDVFCILWCDTTRVYIWRITGPFFISDVVLPSRIPLKMFKCCKRRKKLERANELVRRVEE